MPAHTLCVYFYPVSSLLPSALQSFTCSEYFIPRERLDELAREFGAEYG